VTEYDMLVESLATVFEVIGQQDLEGEGDEEVDRALAGFRIALDVVLNSVTQHEA